MADENRWAAFSYIEIRYLAWALARAPRTPLASVEAQWLQADLLTEMLNRSAVT